MKYELMKLPYPYNALEPYIDEKTMEVHHSKHHQTYVNNLNNLLDKYPELFDKSLDQLLSEPKLVPEEIRQGVINQGGGVYNHNFFWQIMSPDKSSPKDALIEKINSDFGSLDKFKEEFSKAALGKFGSGWAWLVKNKEGKLQIVTTSNQDTTLPEGNTPILNLDVWEHAYYLKYQNRRNEYIENWWNVVNWNKVEELFKTK